MKQIISPFVVSDFNVLNVASHHSTLSQVDIYIVFFSYKGIEKKGSGLKEIYAILVEWVKASWAFSRECS